MTESLKCFVVVFSLAPDICCGLEAISRIDCQKSGRRHDKNILTTPSKQIHTQIYNETYKTVSEYKLYI